MPRSIADELADRVRVRKGPPCGMGVVLERLDDTDRKALQEALDDRLVSAAWIRSILERNGHNLSNVQVQRHRRGECQCR